MTLRQASETTDRPATGLSRRAALRGLGGGLAVVLTARAASASARTLSRAKAAPEHGLVGTWVITFLPAAETEAPTARVLTTFTADGIVQESLPPAWAIDGGRRYGGAAQGLWAPMVDGTYVYRCLAFDYDESGVYRGEWTYRVDLALDPTGEALTGSFARRQFDVDGTLVGELVGGIQGIRADADPPGADAADPADLPPQPGRPGEPY